MIAAVSFLSTRRLCPIQEKAHEFCLTMHACLLEDVEQVRSDRGDSDTEASCGGLPPIASHDLQRQFRLRSRQTELAAQAHLPAVALLLLIFNQDDRRGTQVLEGGKRRLRGFGAEGDDDQPHGQAPIGPMSFYHML